MWRGVWLIRLILGYRVRVSCGLVRFYPTEGFASLVSIIGKARKRLLISFIDGLLYIGS